MNAQGDRQGANQGADIETALMKTNENYITCGFQIVGEPWDTFVLTASFQDTDAAGNIELRVVDQGELLY